MSKLIITSAKKQREITIDVDQLKEVATRTTVGAIHGGIEVGKIGIELGTELFGKLGRIKSAFITGWNKQ
jgi:hypothetical protein